MSFFCVAQDRTTVVSPLEYCEVRNDVDVLIRVHGGGTTGQAGACMQGIARALLKHDSDLEEKLREKKLPHPRCSYERAKEARSSRCTSWNAVSPSDNNSSDDDSKAVGVLPNKSRLLSSIAVLAALPTYLALSARVMVDLRLGYAFLCVLYRCIAADRVCAFVVQTMEALGRLR